MAIRVYLAVRWLALRSFLFFRRLYRAIQYFRKLNYTWRLAWFKAGYGSGLNDEHADVRNAGTR